MLYVFDVAAYSIGHDCVEIGVTAQKPWGEPPVETEHVVHHKHLAIASPALKEWGALEKRKIGSMQKGGRQNC